MAVGRWESIAAIWRTLSKSDTIWWHWWIQWDNLTQLPPTTTTSTRWKSFQSMRRKGRLTHHLKLWWIRIQWSRLTCQPRTCECNVFYFLLHNEYTWDWSITFFIIIILDAIWTTAQTQISMYYQWEQKFYFILGTKAWRLTSNLKGGHVMELPSIVLPNLSNFSLFILPVLSCARWETPNVTQGYIILDHCSQVSTKVDESKIWITESIGLDMKHILQGQRLHQQALWTCVKEFYCLFHLG